MRKYFAWFSLAPLMMAACVGTSKSSNPLSPTVAGPIPGVDISAPAVVDPSGNARIDSTKQPITLIVQNAATSGVRPLSYMFEIATDANFTTKVFTRANVPQDAAGRTSLKLPDQLSPERTYYWHARAEDGANTGPFSSTINFDVFTPVVIQAPVLRSPIGVALVTSLRPQFSFTNAQRSGPAGAISYRIELSESDTFAPAAAVTINEQAGNQTNYDPPQDIPAGKTLFWRVIAFDNSNVGPWSATQAFRTPVPVVVVVPPPAGGGGGGNGSGHVPAGALTVSRAHDVVIGTGLEFPNLTAVFSNDDAALAAADELLRRTIWHLQLAGFNAARQRNPSGLISSDKLCIFLDGSWHVYDIFTLGFAGHATTVHFDEITGANPIPDPGIPD